MSKDIGLSTGQARLAWTEGFKSASSLCESVVKELLESARFVPERQVYEILPEIMDLQLSRVKEGMYKEMRVAERAGLDYYFAQSAPQTVLGGKAV